MKNLKEAAMIGLTGSRLVVAGEIVRRVETHKSIAVAMGVFVALDVLDGVVARKFSADTPKRRIVDALVDNASIGFVALATLHQNPSSAPYIAALAARSAVVGYANYKHYDQTGRSIPTSPYQQIAGLSSAAFAIGANSGSELMMHTTGLMAVGANMLSAADSLNRSQPDEAGGNIKPPTEVY